MNQRFYSLDVFRGATVALMILVNNPGSWSFIYPPLKHATWHGCTPTDLVFPFFLFAVGNAMAFVMPKLEVAAQKVFWQKTLKRTFLIFAIGLFLNWFPFCFFVDDVLVVKTWNYATVNSKGTVFGVRIFGVLQRIALSYGVAAILIYFLKTRWVFITSIFILLSYWFLCVAANPNDTYSLQGWFGTAIDKMLLGTSHLYQGEGMAFDPEGLMATLPSIVQVIFGYLIGNYIIQKGKTADMVNGLFVIGCILLFTGMVWSIAMPLNKKIWTSSYTIYTTGLATIILAILIYLIEIKQHKGAWTNFFNVFGKNALFIFALSGMLPRLAGLIRINEGLNAAGNIKYTTAFTWFYEHVCKPILPVEPRFGSLLYALLFIALMWFCAWLLHKKNIYIKV